jgi:Rieske Fe-S protein
MAQEIDRRGFARRVLAGVGALFAAVFGVPAAATVVDPALRSRKSGWTDVGAASELKEGAPTRAAYRVAAGWEEREQPVFLIRTGEAVVALSATCTHAGCRVRFKDDRFRCPCHGGVFSREGEPLEGPPKRPLGRHDVRIRDGRVEIRLG